MDRNSPKSSEGIQPEYYTKVSANALDVYPSLGAAILNIGSIFRCLSYLLFSTSYNIAVEEASTAGPRSLGLRNRGETS